jgi:hypothetical protein
MSRDPDPKYRELSPQALRAIVETVFAGLAPTWTHEQRFALAELVERAEAADKTRKVAK